MPELDALRGLAALSVVLYHAFPFVFFFGWSFVDCFFVLSGYLITTILLTNVGSPNLLPAFYFRRVLRIWPIYYGTLALVLSLNSLARTGFATTRGGLLQNLFFVQNVQSLWGAASPAFVAPFSPSWSVAIEEQFYLCWPLLIVLLGRRWLVPTACTLVLVCTAYQFTGSPPILTILCRGDGLAVGCLLAALLGRPDRKRVVGVLKWLACGSFIVLLCAAVVWWRSPYCPPRPWYALLLKSFACFFASGIGLCVHYSGHPWLAPLRLRALRRLGLISYSLYMLHLPLFNWMPSMLDRAGVTSPEIRWFLIWTSIIVVPTCSYLLIERPILSLKRVLKYG